MTERIAFLRQWAEGRELSRSLRESLLRDDDGWKVRDSAGSNSTAVEYLEGGSPAGRRFVVRLVPCCLCRGCQTVQVCVCTGDTQGDGAVVWMGPLARLLLRNVVRLCVLRWANKVADKSLGN